MSDTHNKLPLGNLI